MRQWLRFTVLFAGVCSIYYGAFGCGGGGGGSSAAAATEPSATRITQLVYATGSVTSENPEDEEAVEGIDQEGIEAQPVGTRVRGPALAVSGTRVDADLDSVFGDENSMAACALFSSVRRFFVYAGQSDAYLCLLQKILKEVKNLPIVVYDGETHSFAVNTSGTAFCDDELDCPVYKLNFRVDNLRTQDSTGATVYGKISAFQMSVCEESAQLISVGQAFDGFNFAFAAEGAYVNGAATHRYEFGFASTMHSELDYLESKDVDLVYSVSYESALDAYGRADESGTVTLKQTYNEFQSDYSTSGSYGAGSGWSLDFVGAATLEDGNVGLSTFDLDKVLVGDGLGTGSASDSSYLGSSGVSLEESWSDELSQFGVKQNVPYAEDEGGGPTVTLTDLCSKDAEVAFDIIDLPTESLSECQDFLLADDFPNCWYLIE